MNQRRADYELLRSFARAGDQKALADFIRRHLDLVYATALRKVGDPGAAEEIAQNVFTILSRKAWRFAPDDSLPAWLHRTTLLESQSWLRGELRRRRREQTAAELGTTMKAPDEQPAFNALVPLLDEALLSLREKDRTALLLRFYDSHSLRDVGAALGVGEDAAQKRVAGAVEKVAQFFQRRGFKTATVTATSAVLQHTAISASATTASAVINASLQIAPLLTGLAATAAKVAALSKAQTVGICLALAVVPIAWKWNQTQDLENQLTALQAEVDHLQTQRENAVADVKRLRAETERLDETRLKLSSTREREQKVLGKLEHLKSRSRAMLTGENYHWPDDLPFVRIPKSTLSSISVAGGPSTPARLESKVNHFLEMSVQEREATAQIFSNYFAGIDRLMESSLYETNRGLTLKAPAGAESKFFVLLPVGERIRTALDQLCTDLATTLGEERWNMVKPDPFEFTHNEQVRLLGYTQYAWDQTQEIAANIFTKLDGEPTASWAADNGTGTSPFPLNFWSSIPLPQGPPMLMDRVKQYFATEAAARLSNPPNK